MGQGFIRSAITVILFIAFIVLVFWVWSGKRKQEYEAAAQLPLDEPAAPAPRKQRTGADQ